MRILYDASSLFNLAAGDLLQLVSKVSTGLIGPQVYAECASIKGDIDEMLEREGLILLDDAALPVDLFFSYLDKFALGQGETECICFAATDRSIAKISCDDRKARKVITSELNNDRLTGTLGLLVEAAGSLLISVDDALSGYQTMIAAGGYLPAVSDQQFRDLVIARCASPC